MKMSILQQKSPKANTNVIIYLDVSIYRDDAFVLCQRLFHKIVTYIKQSLIEDSDAKKRSKVYSLKSSCMY